MSNSIRKLIAVALASATLLTGGVMASADTADDTGGGLTVTQDPKETAEPSETTGDKTGGQDGDDTAKTTGQTRKAVDGTDAGETESAEPKTETKTGTPKATVEPKTDGNGKATIETIAVDGTSLAGVTTTFYRIGTYPKDGITKKTTFDALHVTDATPAVTARLASEGVNADTLWHMTDPERQQAILARLTDGAGAKPAAVITDQGKATVPEGLYLAVPSGKAPQPVLAGTTLGGDSPADMGLGAAVVNGVQMLDGTVTDGETAGRTADDMKKDTGIMGRMLSLFAAPRASAKYDHFVKKINQIPLWGISYYAGDFVMNNGRHALCTVASANTPTVNVTKYRALDYKNDSNGDIDDSIRSVFYHSYGFPGNIFGKDRNKSIVMTHYAISYFHNWKNPTAAIPSQVLADAQFKKLLDYGKHHPMSVKASHIRIIYYQSQDKSKQDLMEASSYRWAPSIATAVQNDNNYVLSDAKWKDWKNQKSSIGSKVEIWDHVSIKVLKASGYTDKSGNDPFKVRFQLNYDKNGDGENDLSGNAYTKIGRDDHSIAGSTKAGMGERLLALDSRHMTPKDIFGTDTWPDGRYWWEVTVMNVSGQDSYLQVDSKDLQQHVRNGVNDPKERFIITTGSGISTQASGSPASSTASVKDRINIAFGTQGAAKGTKLTVKTRLNYDANNDGKPEKFTDKTITHEMTAASSGSTTYGFDSASFTPSDLGMTTWEDSGSEKYWYDVTVTAPDGRTFTHNGGNDGKEQFTVKADRLLVDTKASDAPASLTGTVTDRVNVTTQSMLKKGAKIQVKSTLNADTDGDGTVDATVSKTKSQALDADLAANKTLSVTSDGFTPKDLGWASWKPTRDKGLYWFDAVVTVDGREFTHAGRTDTNEQFKMNGPSYPDFSTKAQGANPAGGTDPVADKVINKSMFPATATVKLNYDSNKDGKADKTKTSASFDVPAMGEGISPQFKPSDFGMTSWQGGKYWFDATVTIDNGDPISLSGVDDPAESWTVTPAVTATPNLTSQAANGLNQGWDQRDVDGNTVFTPTDANRATAGTQTLKDQVRLSLTGGSAPYAWDANGDGQFDGTLRIRVATTLHTPDGEKTKTISYDTYGTAGDAGLKTFTFTPAELNTDGWTAGDYWFTSKVTGVTGATGVDFTCPAGQVPMLGGAANVCLKDIGKETSAMNGAESAYLAETVIPSITTQIASRTTDDGRPVKDTVTVTMPTNVSGMKVTARGALYWSAQPGDEANDVDRDARKVADLEPLTFNAGDFKNGKATKTFTPPTSIKDLGTGHYTYVWRIDKKDLTGQTWTVTWDWRGKGWGKSLTYPSDQLLSDMPDSITDGWRPGREQMEMAAKWSLKLHKTGHMGQADGVWRDQFPAKGARFEFREVTGADGRTFANGSQAQTITLDDKGEGTLPTQTIQAGQTRWYRLTETAVDKPFYKPENGAYWIVKAVNTTGTRGATVTVTGSSDETKWLVRGEATGKAADTVSVGSGLKNQPDEWTQRLGDTMKPNVMTPLTGGARDIAVIAGLAGLATLAVLAAGYALTRRSRRNPRHTA